MSWQGFEFQGWGFGALGAQVLVLRVWGWVLGVEGFGLRLPCATQLLYMLWK